MTGYAKVEKVNGTKRFIVEIKSLNNRYCEIISKITSGYAFLDVKIKNYVRKKNIRGKLEVTLTIEELGENEVEIEINQGFTKAYVKSLLELGNRYCLPNDISIMKVANCSQVFNIVQKNRDEGIWNDLEPVFKETLNKLNHMKSAEGKEIEVYIRDKSNHVLILLNEIEKLYLENITHYREHLEKKIKEILKDIQIDEQRVLTEVSIFADKTDISEEVMRLRSHFKQMESIMNLNTNIGKKMDFLVQEMNREINTIGSKANNADISHIVVDVKSELEKIREQIQNVE